MTRTLADMTPAERYDCVGRWCDVEGWKAKVVLLDVDEDESSALVVIAHMERKRTGRYFLNDLTPRWDLPRAWTPSGEPVPGEWVESPSSEHHHRWCARWEQKPDEVAP